MIKNGLFTSISIIFSDNICKHCSPNGHCLNKTQCVCDEGFVGDGISCSG